jgi:hypothetical protein
MSIPPLISDSYFLARLETFSFAWSNTAWNQNSYRIHCVTGLMLITHKSVIQRPSWETNSHSASQEILCSVEPSSLPRPLSWDSGIQFTPSHSLCLCNICFNLVLPSMPRSCNSLQDFKW